MPQILIRVFDTVGARSLLGRFSRVQGSGAAICSEVSLNGDAFLFELAPFVVSRSNSHKFPHH